MLNKIWVELGCVGVSGKAESTEVGTSRALAQLAKAIHRTN